MVKYEPLRDEYIFYGGCYPGNNTYKLEQGKLGEEVNFNNVEIEIREFNDPIAQAGELTNYKYHFGQFWRYISFLMKILLVVSIGLLGYTTYLIIQEKNELQIIPREDNIIKESKFKEVNELKVNPEIKLNENKDFESKEIQFLDNKDFNLKDKENSEEIKIKEKNNQHEDINKNDNQNKEIISEEQKLKHLKDDNKED